MRIFTYAATDPHVPPGRRFIARIGLEDGNMHPVLFEGSSLEALPARVQAWWDDELARAQAKRAPRKSKTATETAAEQEPVEAPVGVVAEDFDVV